MPGAWGAGPHSAPGPQECFHPCICLANLHCPNCWGCSCRLPRLGGPPRGLERRSAPAPGDCPSPSHCPLPGRLCSRGPRGGRGHNRAISPSWRVPGVRVADGVRVVRPHGKAGEVDAFCPEDQHVSTGRKEILQGGEPGAAGPRPSPWGLRRPWRCSLGGGRVVGLSISEHRRILCPWEPGGTHPPPCAG